MKLFGKKFISLLLMLMVMMTVSAADASEKMRGDFMSLYASEWRLFNLNYRLFTLIDKEVDTQAKSMPFGLKGLRFTINKNDTAEKILSGIFTKFRPDYERFLRHFQSAYQQRLKADDSDFSIDKLSGVPSFDDVQALQRDGEQNFLDTIGARLKARLSDRLASPYVAGIFLVIGFAMILFRRLLTASIKIKKIPPHRLRVIVCVVGLTIVAWGTYQFSRVIFMTDNITREFLNEQIRILYVSQLPETYWEAVAPHI
ncbi:MAG: hypothetical protein IJU31_04685 [Synergistaceae bacterium]|nr:hypothetical protein [Synergistaceae bacterium]